MDDCTVNQNLPIWRCHDGRKLLVRDMDDTHLENAIRMIKRGFDRENRPVLYPTRQMLPHLVAEKNRRENAKYCADMKLLSEVSKVKKKIEKPCDYVDVRFSESPARVYTYKVRKGAKCHLGQKLVVGNDNGGNSIVFVVGINTGRVGTVEITEKVVKL